MDGGRFDALVKRLAGSVSRRGAIGAVGAAGVGAIAGATPGPSAGAAQTARRVVTCEWRIEAEISSGPHRGDRYDGRLTLEIDRDGYVDYAELELAVPDSPPPVYVGVGMVNGRSLDVRLEGGECEVLAFTGVGTDDITSCDGRIAGSFQGPNLVDLGGWRTHTDTWCPEGERWDEQACGCVAACEEQTCPAGETLDPETCRCEPGREDSACPGVICRGRFLLDTGTCQCYCPSDACPADGSWYLEPNTCECSCQLTKCPDGYEVDRDYCLCLCEKQECNGDLVWNGDLCQCGCPTDPCPSGYFRDESSCQCVCDPGCPPDTVIDYGTCSCACPVGAGLTYCGGDIPYCADLSSSIDDCGACGSRCGEGVVACIGGNCVF